jgi:hypothetical protein
MISYIGGGTVINQVCQITLKDEYKCFVFRQKTKNDQMLEDFYLQK